MNYKRFFVIIALISVLILMSVGVFGADVCIYISGGHASFDSNAFNNPEKVCIPSGSFSVYISGGHAATSDVFGSSAVSNNFNCGLTPDKGKAAFYLSSQGGHIALTDIFGNGIPVYCGGVSAEVKCDPGIRPTTCPGGLVCSNGGVCVGCSGDLCKQYDWTTSKNYVCSSTTKTCGSKCTTDADCKGKIEGEKCSGGACGGASLETPAEQTGMGRGFLGDSCDNPLDRSCLNNVECKGGICGGENAKCSKPDPNCRIGQTCNPVADNTKCVSGECLVDPRNPDVFKCSKPDCTKDKPKCKSDEQCNSRTKLCESKSAIIQCEQDDGCEDYQQCSNNQCQNIMCNDNKACTDARTDITLQCNINNNQCMRATCGIDDDCLNEGDATNPYKCINNKCVPPVGSVGDSCEKTTGCVDDVIKRVKTDSSLDFITELAKCADNTKCLSGVCKIDEFLRKGLICGEGGMGSEGCPTCGPDTKCDLYTKQCVSAQDCPKCLENQVCDESKTPKICTTKGDDGTSCIPACDPTKFCEAGACKDRSVDECTTTADCTSLGKIGYTCSSGGVCVPPEEECTSLDDVSCKPYTCNTNAKECLTECVNNNNCQTGFECNANNECVSKGGGDGGNDQGEGEDCLIDANCKPGLICILDENNDYTCQYTLCQNDADCAPGSSCKDKGYISLLPTYYGRCIGNTGCTSENMDDVCDGLDCNENGECVLPDGGGVNCADDDECPTGYVCGEQNDIYSCMSKNRYSAEGCFALGGATCSKGDQCFGNRWIITSGTSYCCGALGGGKNPCVSKEKSFVPSLGEEAYIVKGPCVNGEREVQYCDDKVCTNVKDTQTEPCTSITKKGTKIPGFGTSALIIGLSAIAVFYFFANKKRRKM